MKLRTLILDDDAVARRELRNLLGAEPDVEVVGEGPVKSAAFEWVARLGPDLLFLEVSAECDALRLLETAEVNPPPEVVVMAGSDQHALAAFDARALDYLLKPFQPGRLARALQRARAQHALRRACRVEPRQLRLLEDLESAPHYLTRFVVKERDRVVFVPVETVAWIEAAENYVILNAGRQRYLVRQTLRRVEASLDPERFFRISRSAIINLAHLAELRPLFKGRYVVVLRDGTRLSVTRSLSELEALLKYS